MAGPNSIDWQPIDTSGLTQIPLLYQAARKAAAQEESLRQNADTQRLYAENQDRKLSADLARQDYEHKHALEREQHQDDIAASTALPMIMRTAASNPGLAGAMGKPYGVQIGHEGQRQMPVDRASPSPTDVAQFLQAGALTPDKPPLQGPTQAGPSLGDPSQELLNYKAPTQAPETSPDIAPEAPVPGTMAPMNIDAATSANEAALPTTRSYYASFKGERFPVQQGADTPFGEEKYDQLYQRLLAQNPTADPQKIEAKVLQMRGQDLVNSRGVTGNDIKQQSLDALGGYRDKSLALNEANNLRNNAAKIAAARLIAMGMNEKTAVGLIGQYNQYDKSAQAAALMKQDQQGMRLEDRIAMELDPTNPNALNQQMAQHSLAALSVSTGAGGVRVPVSVIHDVKTAYSAALSAKNYLYKQLHGGENDPQVVAVMNDAQQKLHALGQGNREGDFRAWDHKAGYGSPWARNPETLGLVKASRDAVREQLGLEPDDTMPDFGDGQGPGLLPGSAPRDLRDSRPQATPAPHRAPKAAKPNAAPAPAGAPVWLR